MVEPTPRAVRRPLIEFVSLWRCEQRPFRPTAGQDKKLPKGLDFLEGSTLKGELDCITPTWAHPDVVAREKKDRRDARRARFEARRQRDAADRETLRVANGGPEETSDERRKRERAEQLRENEETKEEEAALPKREELPEGLELFMFPLGIRLLSAQPEPSLHSFALNNGMHAFCYTNYSVLPPTELGVVKLQIISNLEARGPIPDDFELPTRLYWPSAICILSRYPYHHTLLSFLKQYMVGRETNGETVHNLYSLLHQVQPHIPSAMVRSPHYQASYLSATITNSLPPSITRAVSAHTGTASIGRAAGGAVTPAPRPPTIAGSEIFTSPLPTPISAAAAPTASPTSATVNGTAATIAAAASSSSTDTTTNVTSSSASSSSSSSSSSWSTTSALTTSLLSSSLAALSTIPASSSSTELPAERQPSLTSEMSVGATHLDILTSPRSPTNSSNSANNTSTTSTDSPTNLVGLQTPVPLTHVNSTNSLASNSSSSNGDSSGTTSPIQGIRPPLLSLTSSSSPTSPNGPTYATPSAAERDLLSQYFFAVPPSPLDTAPHIEAAALAVLFRSLEPNNIINLFNAMLCEIPILVTSLSLEKITPAMEALHALIYPMKWSYIYIPLLPLYLCVPVGEIFDAPQAYMMGVSSEALKLVPPDTPAVLVDLDCNQVKFMTPSLSFASTAPSRQSMPSVPYKPCYTYTRLPHHLSWRLHDGITRHFNLWKYAHPQLVATPPIGLPAHADASVRRTRILEAKDEGSVARDIMKEKELCKNSTNPFPSLTLAAIRELHSGSDDDSDDGTPTALPTTTPRAEVKVTASTSSMTPAEKNRRMQLEERGALRVRRTFLSVFVSLFRQYRDCMSNALNPSSTLDRRLAPSISVSPIACPIPAASSRAPLSIFRGSSSGGRPAPVASTKKGGSSSSSSFSSSSSSVSSSTSSVNNESDAEAADALDYKKFFARSDAYNSEFMTDFSHTQMCRYFLQERLTLASDDWFEEALTTKLHRRMHTWIKYEKKIVSGVLWKEGQKGKFFGLHDTWRQRFVEIDGLKLSYFEMTTDFMTKENQYQHAVYRFKRAAHDRRADVNELFRRVQETRSAREDVRTKQHKGTIMLVPGYTDVEIPVERDQYKTPFSFRIIFTDPTQSNRSLLLSAATDEIRLRFFKAIRARTFIAPISRTVPTCRADDAARLKTKTSLRVFRDRVLRMNGVVVQRTIRRYERWHDKNLGVTEADVEEYGTTPPDDNSPTITPNMSSSSPLLSRPPSSSSLGGAGSGSGSSSLLAGTPPMGHSPPAGGTDWDAPGGPGPSSRVPKTSPTSASSSSKRGSGIDVSTNGEHKRAASRAIGITSPSGSGSGTLGSSDSGVLTSSPATASSSSLSPSTSSSTMPRPTLTRVDATNLDHALHIAEELNRELDVRDRRFGNTTVHECFSGSDAVAYMVSHGLAESVADAIAVGNLLFQAGVISHARYAPKEGFVNEDRYYRFNIFG